ncbi:hypothetical protein SRHO_G00034630 [Serrasalmus rhombeus]
MLEKEEEEDAVKQEDQMEQKREEATRCSGRGKEAESDRRCLLEQDEGPEEKIAGRDVAGGRLVWDIPAGGRFGGLPAQWSVGQEVVDVFECCLEEVEHLQLRRETLVQELLALERPLQAQLQDLRLQLTHARSRLSHAELHTRTLQEEVKRVKRKLFTVMRDCIQSQITLSAQKYEVEQFTFIQEELQDEVLQRLQELTQLRENQQSRLATLREQLQGQHRPRATSDLSHCRRASADLSRYTRASMKSLEEWYEPRLLAMLRRKQATEDTLRRSRELGQDLKKRLEPLREESRKIELERERLQQRIELMEEEKRERVAQHRETVSSLEERVRELQTEIQIQINTNRQLTEINHCLTAQSQVYRRCLGYTDGPETPDEETETEIQ